MLRTVLLAVALVATGGCTERIAMLGEHPLQARRNAEQLLSALGGRFGLVRRDSALETIRSRILRNSLAPSRLIDDSTLWTGHDGEVRLLGLAGGPGRVRGEPYEIRVAADPRPPTDAGSYRRMTRLARIGDGTFEWRTRDELAVGDVRVADLDASLHALLSLVGSTDADVLRAAAREHLPRTAEELGLLYSLDTLRTTPVGGAGDVVLAATLRARSIAERYPSYGRYLEKYLEPVTARATLSDRSGSPWAELTVDHGHLHAHFRVLGGALTPLVGAPRSIPDTLVMTVDARTKMMLFSVGLRRLVGDVVLTRTRHRAAAVASFRREPNWVLPPLAERLLRSPLRRPFEEEGAWFAVELRDAEGPGGVTVAAREYRLAVQESAIARWLGGLGNTALSEFRQGAEREADIYFGRLWNALRVDVAAQLGAPAPASSSPR